MIYSDEHLARLSESWTPAEVREVIRQYRLALQALDAVQVFVPPRNQDADVATVASVIAERCDLPGAQAKKIARSVMSKLALPNSEVHASIVHFRARVMADAPPVTTVLGKPVCVSPNGRTDGHGKFVKMVCAFCGAPPMPRDRSQAPACGCEGDEPGS